MVFERESCNLTSINYWIQESITSNTLPDLSDWDEIKQNKSIILSRTYYD